MQNEVNILKGLNHANIIKLIDFQNYTNQADLLVFPYYKLGDLFQVVTYHGSVSITTNSSLMKNIAGNTGF
jgi:hypothetical protein